MGLSVISVTDRIYGNLTDSFGAESGVFSQVVAVLGNSALSEVVDMWSVTWSICGRRLVYGRCVVGMWSIFDQYVVGTRSVCLFVSSPTTGRYVVGERSTFRTHTNQPLQVKLFNPFTPKFKKCILPTFQRETYKWGSDNW